ncbi:MAG: potassium channel family protein [Verrucomicrobiales bacterium]|nr:potassium channel family protein [Verrucomicrobiales bacterium]
MKNPFTIKLQASVLLAGESLLLLTSALWEDIDPNQQWPAWLYVILFAAGGYTLAGSRQWLVAYLLTSTVAIVLGTFESYKALAIVSTVCFAIAFYMLFKVVIGHCFFRVKVAAADRIIGGIAGYILLGFLWTSQSQWALMLNAEAFLNTNSGLPTTEAEQLYYSFVTLTGLGYGEIVPTTSVARLIAILTVLSGTLYLAIFISALMGGLAAKHHSEKN